MIHVLLFFVMMLILGAISKISYEHNHIVEFEKIGNSFLLISGTVLFFLVIILGIEVPSEITLQF